MRGYQFSLGFLILGCATSRQQIPVREGRDATIGCYQFDRPHWTSLTLFGNSDSVASSIPPVFVELHQTGRVTPALHVLGSGFAPLRSEEHTSELQSHVNLVCRLLLEKKKNSYTCQ